MDMMFRCGSMCEDFVVVHVGILVFVWFRYDVSLIGVFVIVIFGFVDIGFFDFCFIVVVKFVFIVVVVVILGRLRRC